MNRWRCGIKSCTESFVAVEDLIIHQATDHRKSECEVCGDPIPAGFLAIRHVFNEHNRAEFVRAYDADSDDIRQRENLIEAIENQTDVNALLNRIDKETDRTLASAD